jgi:glycosyltransferase involved in cell wall biosynthesis
MISLYNPLPIALGHYESACEQMFVRIGIASQPCDSACGEGHTGPGDKIWQLAQHLHSARRAASVSTPAISIWPLLGWYELPLWASRQGRNVLVIHDPRPLRRQVGLTDRAARLARSMTRSATSPQVVVHSKAAEGAVSSALEKRGGGAAIHLLRHPIHVPTRAIDRRDEPIAAILGQFKPARDLKLLEQLGPALRAAGWTTRIAGRGWPQINGWTVENRFMTETEFTAELRRASALFLPYQHYFQSGVAIRAAEMGVPVVGHRSPFLADLMGSNYSGFPPDAGDADAWLGAAQAVIDSGFDMEPVASAYMSRADADWTAFSRAEGWI